MNIYLYVKNSFLKCHKRHSKKWTCNANTKSIGCLLEKSFSHLDISMCMSIFIQSEQVCIFCQRRCTGLPAVLQFRFS